MTSRSRSHIARSIAKVGVCTLAATVAAVGCATLGKSIKGAARTKGLIDEPVLKRSVDAPADYLAAVKLIEEGRNERGLVGLEAFLQHEPVSPWTEAAWFNQGRACEGMERWTEAIERYRAVAADATNRAPKLQANALYRLSFCFEALGRDADAIAALKDASRLSQFLEREVAEAELPARLAAMYARVGNHAEADALYERAENGIAKLRRDPAKKDVPEWLPRTLFYMGATSLSHTNWDEFEIGLRPLKRSQSYLLQAAEMGVQPWSDRAAQELISIYRELWNVIEQAPLPPVSDPLTVRRRVQERQWDLAALVQEQILALKAIRLPVDESVSKQAESVLQVAAEVEKKIAQLYAQRPVGEGLTPESLARQRSVRGRVVSPDSSLEKLFQQQAKKLPAKMGRGAQPEAPSLDSSAEATSEAAGFSSSQPPLLPATHIPESEPAPIRQASPPVTEDPNL